MIKKYKFFDADLIKVTAPPIILAAIVLYVAFSFC